MFLHRIVRSAVCPFEVPSQQLYLVDCAPSPSPGPSRSSDNLEGVQQGYYSREPCYGKGDNRTLVAVLQGKKRVESTDRATVGLGAINNGNYDRRHRIYLRVLGAGSKFMSSSNTPGQIMTDRTEWMIRPLKGNLASMYPHAQNTKRLRKNIEHNVEDII